MNLEELKKEWEKDCVIDDIELDKSSLAIPKLHAKYAGMMSDKIITLKKIQYEYNKLMKLKWLWFQGKLSENEIKELGWADDPFDGLKIMKNDFSYYFNSDPDLQQLSGKIEYLKICIEFSRNKKLIECYSF